MRRGARTATGWTTAMVALLAVPVPAASAASHPGGVRAPATVASTGTSAAPPPSSGPSGAGGSSEAGGTQYGAKLPVSPAIRPVARRFTIAPSSVVAPALPTVLVRIDQRGTRTVRARLALVPRTKGSPVARIDLGQVRVGRSLRVAWPAGVPLAPGRYLVRLQVRGRWGTVLARSAGAPGRAPLIVRPPAPPPPPPAAPGGHAFPVAGPHTYGDGFGAPRRGYSHQGQDILAAEGTPVVAPSAGTISYVDDQPSAAGFYVVENASDGYDYFFAHCQEASTVVAPGQAVAAGQQLCRVGQTGDATGPHLHFEAWLGGWRVNAGSHPIDPLALLKSWDLPAARG